ncbi:hypothetical protein AMECASPLE_021304, partial [Ameca splendens]
GQKRERVVFSVLCKKPDKPTALEVTYYQLAKVMAAAPVRTSSICTTVPGTAVCAFAFVCA